LTVLDNINVGEGAIPQVRQELENGNFVFLKVKHKNIRTLTDTGVHFLCVLLSFLKTVRSDKDVLPAPCHKKIFTADGQAMKVFGTILLSINI